MDEFQQYIEKQKYLLIMCDGNTNHCNTYNSLRTLSRDIDIDYSTISKKLKNSNSFYLSINDCYYFIQKLLNS
jgi:hypothetical protein